MDPNWVSRKIAEFYQAPNKTWGMPWLKLSERFPSDGRLSLIHCYMMGINRVCLCAVCACLLACLLAHMFT